MKSSKNLIAAAVALVLIVGAAALIALIWSAVAGKGDVIKAEDLPAILVTTDRDGTVNIPEDWTKVTVELSGPSATVTLGSESFVREPGTGRMTVDVVEPGVLSIDSSDALSARIVGFETSEES